MNRKLLLATAKRIEKHPEHFSWSDWGCGTKGCIAWHICLEAGWKPVLGKFAEVAKDGGHRYAGNLAAELAGLSVTQRNYLFISGLAGAVTGHDRAAHSVKAAKFIRNFVRTGGLAV